jgi:lysophospholipase L1-like esterase
MTAATFDKLRHYVIARSLAVLLGFALGVAPGPAELLAQAGDADSRELDTQSVARAATRSAPQTNPMFAAAHEALLKKAKQGVIDVYFLGDSITRRWQGTDYPAHKQNWDRNFFGRNAANFGWGGDTTQNVLWRLENGELDGIDPKVIVLMIGTNNVGGTPQRDDTALVEEVSQGIHAILSLCRQKAPAAHIVLVGITPRNTNGSPAVMPTIDRINARIAKFADGRSIRYLNINDKLADPSGKLFDGVTNDGLHLSNQGYQIWADALQPIFTEWLGPPAAVDRGPPASGVPQLPAPPSAD